MKTILVPVGGGDTDAVVFETAMALAAPLAAHLEFVHVRLSAAEAALHTPHIGFARGAALRAALDDLAQRARDRSLASAHHAREFCARHRVDLVEQPCASSTVTARWREEQGDPVACLVRQARHNDLVVMARARKSDGLASDRIETLLMESGRPLLIVPHQTPRSLLGTVMVCWKETPESARALSAAIPLLGKARRVVLAHVGEGDDIGVDALDGVVRQLQWHGISAEPCLNSADGRPTVELLWKVAGECSADLLVMGGYGRWRSRELLFGGCTQAVIDGAGTAAFVMH
jgi:nucleotide-binding universal stress UspA family protein